MEEIGVGLFTALASVECLAFNAIKTGREDDAYEYGRVIGKMTRVIDACFRQAKREAIPSVWVM